MSYAATEQVSVTPAGNADQRPKELIVQVCAYFSIALPADAYDGPLPGLHVGVARNAAPVYRRHWRSMGGLRVQSCTR